LTGQRLSIGFTTSHAVGRILGLNNDPSATLTADIRGVPFSCETWTQEDGPGTLVLSAPNIDTRIAAGVVADILAEFELSD
jgi:hypothetical protein